MAFFRVLSSVPLSNNPHSASILVDFDFRKLCFRQDWPLDIDNTKLLMKNVRDFNHLCLLLPTFNLARLQFEITPPLFSPELAGPFLVKTQQPLLHNWIWREEGFAGDNGRSLHTG